MDISLLLPLFLLVLFIPILLSGRKQRRQMQEMQQMQRDLAEGDVVVTTSGLRGIVVDASFEDTIDLEIADDVVTTWLRAAVREKVVAEQADVTTDDADETPAVPAADPAPAASTDAPSLTKDETPRS